MAFQIKYPKAMTAMTPKVTPTPIPAFAFAERLLLVASGLLITSGIVVCDDVPEVKLVENCSTVDDGSTLAEEEGEGVGIGSPNLVAIVCRAIRLPGLQHSLLSSQHHSNDVVFPVHGVTFTLFII